jgi:hypothetical protein
MLIKGFTTVFFRLLQQELIAWLKSVSAASLHATSMSPSCVQQILSALRVLKGEDGSNIGVTFLSFLVGEAQCGKITFFSFFLCRTTKTEATS